MFKWKNYTHLVQRAETRQMGDTGLEPVTPSV